MAIQWTVDLATGVEEIDNQHKELFKRTNDLLDISEKSKKREEIVKVLDFLGEYVVSHFGAEQLYMTRHYYPAYTSHKAQHDEFIREFKDLRAEYEKEGVTSHLVIVVQNRVYEWLRNHIGNVDKQLGAFLKSRL